MSASIAKANALSVLPLVTSLSASFGVSEYDLEGSQLDVGSPDNTLALSGKAAGFVLDLGLELNTSSRSRFAFFTGLRYRYLKVNPIRVSGTVGPFLYQNAPVQNYDGSVASVDFSGLSFQLGLSSYIGGRGKSK